YPFEKVTYSWAVTQLDLQAQIAPLLLFLIACSIAARQTVQCAALIAPYVSSSIRWGGVTDRTPRNQSNRRGNLRPDSSDLPA
ncbi:hypothetical protein, partial [Aeromonas media]|uniref:hypothetical protein n=1 Tax=Aeromonas media TaxID=651 RepID=UPI001F16938E